jgi:hypothetical protein
MYKFQHAKLVLLATIRLKNITYHIFIVVYPDDEIKGGISTIEYFVLPVFQK